MREIISANKNKIIQIVITILLFLVAHLPNLSTGLEFAIYLVAYLIIGFGVIKEAIEHIFQGKWFDENFLMMIATVGAFAVKQYPEAVAVMLFYALGELFEDIAVERSRASITQLLDIRPEYANLVAEDGSVTKIAPAQVQLGEVIKIKPGERVPLDGKVISGSAYLDTAALTGESEPRLVEAGTQILSGAIVLDSVLEVQVTKPYGESTVAKILELVQNASQKKAPTEKFITKFAQVYTPIVVGAALLLAIIPPLFFGQPFNEWFYRALIFLVISCPCALVISIPLGFFAGIGASSKAGVLVKGSNYLELLTQIQALVFDKTGTLTEGKFRVENVYPNAGIKEAELVELAAIAEMHSPHPIARSIVEYFPGKLPTEKLAIVKEVVGQGIKAVFADQELLVGKKALLNEHGIALAELPTTTTGTLVYVAYAGKYLGCLEIADTLKQTSATTLKELKNKGSRR